MELTVTISNFTSLTNHQSLVDGMLLDRRRQFVDRQAWDIPVLGRYEIDQFDYRDFNPVYVIVGIKNPYGNDIHIGSARLMPTTGRTMLNEIFLHMIDGPISDPKIWEVTRMVVSPLVNPELQKRAIPMVLYAGNEFFRAMGIERCVAVFSKSMLPIYKRQGNSPMVIGEGVIGGDTVLIGEFPCDAALSERLLKRMGTDAERNAIVVAEALIRYKTGNNL